MSVPNHLSVVREARARYAAIMPTSKKRGFAITNAVAYALRGEGAGLVSKPNGSNVQGYSADVLMHRDGTAIRRRVLQGRLARPESRRSALLADRRQTCDSCPRQGRPKWGDPA